jgi:nicotinamidase-related amidase
MPSIEPSRRVLIVVDVQNDYDGGNLAIELPPFNATVREIARAMDEATARGIKVVVVKMIAPPTAPVFRLGTHGAELHPEIARRPHDHYVEKTLPSAFTGTDLELWLRRNGIETVTVVGYMSQNCDLSTVVHAMHMGFDVEFLSDATGAISYANQAGHATAEEIHRVVKVVLQARFAAVLTTRSWIGHLDAGTAPPRDNIYGSHQSAIAITNSDAA